MRRMRTFHEFVILLFCLVTFGNIHRPTYAVSHTVREVAARSMRTFNEFVILLLRLVALSNIHRVLHTVREVAVRRMRVISEFVILLTTSHFW